jgi:hypothetical protein
VTRLSGVINPTAITTAAMKQQKQTADRRHGGVVVDGVLLDVGNSGRQDRQRPKVAEGSGDDRAMSCEEPGEAGWMLGWRK